MRYRLLLLIAFALVIAGCGGSSNNDDYYYDDYPPYDNGGYVPDPIPNPNPGGSQLLAYYDAYDLFTDTIIEVDEFDGVLSNDIYTIGATDIFFPRASVQGGDITGYSDGSFDYEPPFGFTGDDSFTYTITDTSGRTSSAQVFLHVYPLD